MPDLNMRAADPCPTNNAKRAKHSKILKPGSFFVFTPFYQWTNSVLCASRTFDFFETVCEEESLASIEREDLFGRDYRLSGDAVISFSASGLAFGET
jgi:hypothetical protein